MRPRNNILAVIAALVVSAQTLPPNIGRGSFSYDPNSIVQNERILRLFLQLASHTANRLIYLKNEAKQQQEESKLHSDANEPKLRIDLPESVPEERIASRGNYADRSRRPGHNNGQDPRSRDRYNHAIEHAEPVNGPYMPATEDSLITEYSYGRKIARRRENDEVPDNPQKDSDEPVEIESRMLFNIEKNNYVTHYNDNSRNTNNADTRINNIASSYQQGSASNVVQSGPVIVNQNTGSSGFHGRTDESYVNRANAVVNNVGSAATGSLVVSRNAGSVLSSQNGGALDNKSAIEAASNLQSGSLSGIQSGNAGVGNAQKKTTSTSNLQSSSESGTQSGSASGINAHQMITSASNRQSSSESGTQSGNAGAGNAHQTMTSTSNLQSGSSGATSSAQSSSTVQSSTAGATIAHQAMSAASNLQSGSTGLINSIQDFASNGQSAGRGISGEAMAAGSNMQSSSLEQLSAVQAAGSDMQSSSLKKLSAVQAAGSNMQSSSLEKLSAVQTSGSKVLTESMSAANGNQASQMMTSLAGSQGRQSSEKNVNGILDSSKTEGSKSEGIRSNANPASVLKNQGSSLANPSKTISVIMNVAKGTSGAATEIVQNGSSKLVQGIQKPGISIARGSSGQASKLLGGLTGVGSKFTGSLVLERGAGTGRAVIETSYKRENSASDPMGSKRSGVTQVGSSLIGTVPLFRSFPELKDQAGSLENAVKEVPTKITKFSSTDDENGAKGGIFGDEFAKSEEDKEGGVSETELKEYAHQFADALRPIGTG